MAAEEQKIILDNLTDGETIHQRCLLLDGTCTSSPGQEDFLSISTLGPHKTVLFPEQNWPVVHGSFKALVMLSPGQNKLVLTHYHNDESQCSTEVNVTYAPLLQYPPVQLAILVAKDSPLLTDCPPSKRGGLSSAHSGVDAAIAKFRMTAYMWQAMTAEDMRQKGLGRRSFRLQEDWIADTVSQEYCNALHDGTLYGSGAIQSTARVHLVRSSQTTAQIRAKRLDASNGEFSPSHGRLHDFFLQALDEYGEPFVSSAHPVVAGLILDAHYSSFHKQTLGHKALGLYDSNGMSLAVYGSHMTHAWPRFLEEVPACLTDERSVGDRISTDNGNVGVNWEACTASQTAFLQTLLNALNVTSSDLTADERDWAKHFVVTPPSSHRTQGTLTVVDTHTPNNLQYSTKAALSLHFLPHFRLPSDTPMSPEFRDAVPFPEVTYEETDGDDLLPILTIECPAGIAQVTIQGNPQQTPSIANPAKTLRYSATELESRFKRPESLSVDILGMNGIESSIPDVWKMLANPSWIRIPGSHIKLYKRSIYSDRLETMSPDEPVWSWAQLLKERGEDGNLYRATSIDLRVGMIWDGGVVYYEDGHKSHWGPMRTNGREHYIGGGNSEAIDLPETYHIDRIQVNRGQHYNIMGGVRMHISVPTPQSTSDDRPAGRGGRRRGAGNRRTTISAGHLNRGDNILELAPGANEVIVGFYGKNDYERNFSGVLEFGIITAPKEVGLDGLPEQTFDLPELRNTDGGIDESGER